MRRRSGLDIPETLEDTCDPATMALIVYDMRAGGYPVFFTRHMSLPVRHRHRNHHAATGPWRGPPLTRSGYTGRNVTSSSA
jgi:hypothetical protein